MKPNVIPIQTAILNTKYNFEKPRLHNYNITFELIQTNLINRETERQKNDSKKRERSINIRKT